MDHANLTLFQLIFQVIVTVVAIVTVGYKMASNMETKIELKLNEIKLDLKEALGRLFSKQDELSNQHISLARDLTSLRAEHNLLMGEHAICHGLRYSKIRNRDPGDDKFED